MKPVKFKGSNLVFGENQKEYNPLPAHKSDKGIVTVCWKLSIVERLKLLLTGTLWQNIWVFDKPIPPQLFLLNKPGWIDIQE